MSALGKPEEKCQESELLYHSQAQSNGETCPGPNPEPPAGVNISCSALPQKVLPAHRWMLLQPFFKGESSWESPEFISF
jgi:hypothetical protein